MIKASRVCLAAVSIFVLAIAACSDDDNPTGGGTTDTTPPGVSSVTPVDAFHVDILFSEAVTRSTAEDTNNYTFTQATLARTAGTLQAPGDPLAIATIALKPDKKTVVVTSASSMAGNNYDLSITGVSDVNGNTITTPVGKSFTGSDATDTTPPSIVNRSPAPNATGVSVAAHVVVQFSEPISIYTFILSPPGGGGGVPALIEQDGATYTLVPMDHLEFNTLYTVSVTANDMSDNSMALVEWTFRTATNNDTTPPTIVSTTPANNAVNVDVNANLSITFSEAVVEGGVTDGIVIVPDVGDGTATWSNGNKTVTFDPANPLLDDQQYTVTIYPGAVVDNGGNGIAGIHTIVFSTGATLADGSIAGTITGDAGTAAADPTGATVAAIDGIPFGGAFNLLASTTVAANNTYTLSHLSDRTYYLLCAMNTAGSSDIDPSEGDAIGAYGINVSTLDFDPDSVIVEGGAHLTGVNFAIYDPSALNGSVAYDGSQGGEGHAVYIGLFDTAGFDPNNPGDPVAASEAYWPYEPSWTMNSIDQLIPDGNYYVGAYLDVNDNGIFEPAVDPAGFYGGVPSPTVVHIANGNDTAGITILLLDPLTSVRVSAGAAWTVKHNATFQRLCEVLRTAER